MHSFLKNILNNKLATQSIMLLVSTFLSMLFLIGTNFYLTKILDLEQYGNYAFIINMFIFSQIVFNFGFFYSICRLISLEKDDVSIRSYYFAGILIWALLSVAMCVSLSLYSILSDDLRNKHILDIFLSILPLGSVYLFTQFNELVLQGDNRIGLLAVSRFFPRLVFFLLTVSFFFLLPNVNLRTILITYFFSYLVIYIYIICKIQPIRNKSGNSFKKIWSINKEYGFPIYIGSIFAVGASNFVGVLLGVLSADNTNVGFYNIALQISIPLSMLPNILSTVLYKKFVFLDFINRKILIILFFLCMSVYLCILIFSKSLILVVFGNRYMTSVPLIKYMCLGALLYGIADFFNKFILSKGCGKKLRNVSLIVGIVVISISYPFIKLWGCYGAAYIKAVAGLVYLSSIIYTYKTSFQNKNGN